MARSLIVMSNSERDTFKQCRKKWWFGYIQKLAEAVSDVAPTWGKIFHDGLDVGYTRAWSPGPQPEAFTVAESAALAAELRANLLIEEFQEALDLALCDGKITEDRFTDIVEKSSAMREEVAFAISHMFRATEDDFDRYTPLGIEKWFEIPVRDHGGRVNTLFSHGKIDLILWDKRAEEVVIVDHKTTSSSVFGFEDNLIISPQMSGYVYAGKEMLKQGKLVRADGGKLPKDVLDRVGRVMFNVVRRKLPSVPHVNKVKKSDTASTLLPQLKALEEATGHNHGAVSTAQIDTLGHIYRNALDDQTARGVPVIEKQLTKLEELSNQGDRYFARHEAFKDASDLEQWRDEMWADSAMMRRARRLPREVTTSPGACMGAMAMRCQFVEVCRNDTPETRSAFVRRISGKEKNTQEESQQETHTDQGDIQQDQQQGDPRQGGKEEGVQESSQESAREEGSKEGSPKEESRNEGAGDQKAGDVGREWGSPGYKEAEGNNWGF